MLHSQSSAKINEDQDAPRVMIYYAENGFLEPEKSMVARGVDVNIHDNWLKHYGDI